MVRSKRSLVVEGTRRLTRSKRSHCTGSKGPHKSKRSKRSHCPGSKGPHRRLRSKRCGHWGSKKHHMGQRGGQGCAYRVSQRGGTSCHLAVKQAGGTGCHCNGTGKPHSHNKRVRGVSLNGSGSGYRRKRNMGPAPRIQ